MLLQGVTVDNYTEATNIQTQSYMFTFTLLEGFSRKKDLKAFYQKPAIIKLSLRALRS